MRLVLVFSGLLTAAISGAVDWTDLFGDPYRTDEQSVTSNSIFAGMTSISYIGLSYAGFAQVPSTFSSSARLLFLVRPSAGINADTFTLPKVFIAYNRYLAANISTTWGNEAYIGPSITLDSWFTFGVTISNGNGIPNNRYILFYINNLDGSSYISQKYTLRGNMFPSSTAVVYAPAISATSASPVPVYLSSLRSFAGTLSAIDFDWGASNFPPPVYSWQIGTELGVLGWEGDPLPRNVSCVGNGVIKRVNTAYWGRPIGLWPNLTPNPSCDTNTTMTIAAVSKSCVNKTSCFIPQENSLYEVNPCSSERKWAAISMSCSTSATSSLKASPTALNPTPSPTTASSASKVSAPWTPSLSASLSTIVSASRVSASGTPSSSASLSSIVSASSSSSKPTASSSNIPLSSAMPPSTFKPSISSASSISAAPSSRISSSSSSSVKPSSSSPSTFVASSDSIPSSMPMFSSESLNVNAWQISLTIGLRTSGVSDLSRNAMVSSFISDMSSALYVPPYRFAFNLVEFRNQTLTSTVLSFVVLPNVTDSDASVVVKLFSQQLQTPGSVLRSGSLLIAAGDPPVPIQVVGVRITYCDAASLYVLSSNPCPSAVASLSSNSTGNVNSSLVLIAGLSGLIVFLAAALYIGVRRFLQKPIATGSTLMTSPTSNATQPNFVVMNGVVFGLNNVNPVHMAHTNEVAAQALPRPFAKARTERKMLGARDKFNQGAHTIDSDFSMLS